MTRYFLFAVCFLFSLSIIGCEDETEEGGNEVEYDLELAQTGYFYIEADSTIGAVPYYSTVCVVNDTDYMAILNIIENSIDLHPLGQGLTTSITIDRKEIGDLLSFHVHNWDSIFVFALGSEELPAQPGRELFMVNRNGELVKEIPMTDQLNLYDPRKSENDPLAESILCTQVDPLAFSGSKLVFALLPYDRDTLLTQKHFSAGVDLSSNSFSYHPLFPDYLTAQSEILYQVPVKHLDASNQRLLFGFRGTPSLQVHNLGANPSAKPEVHSIFSDYLKMNHAPSKDDLANAPNSSMLQMQSFWGSFGNILQSPDDIYLRFVYYARQDSLFEVTYANRKVPGPNNMLCSVVLFDKNFQKRGESGTFEGLVDKNAGFSKDGTLYVLDYNEEESESNRIRYAKFRIQEIKPMQNES